VQLSRTFNGKSQTVTERRIPNSREAIPHDFGKGAGMSEDSLIHATARLQRTLPTGRKLAITAPAHESLVRESSADSLGAIGQGCQVSYIESSFLLLKIHFHFLQFFK
jgi:hypothetical protein